jgi:hypothetical protein
MEMISGTDQINFLMSGACFTAPSTVSQMRPEPGYLDASSR